jgi:transposase-like protein
MEFPKIDFADEEACFQRLFHWVHSQGLHCPHCGESDGIGTKANHRQQWRTRYRCEHCGRTFNAWTGTPLQGTHRWPSEILKVMQAWVEGKSTRQLAGELDCDRGRLAHFRHRIQPLMITLFGLPPKKH